MINSINKLQYCIIKYHKIVKKKTLKIKNKPTNANKIMDTPLNLNFESVYYGPTYVLQEDKTEDKTKEFAG